jgi:hypothetical protein
VNYAVTMDGPPLSFAAVASVVPLLQELRWVGCFINSTSDPDRDRTGLGTGKNNTLISLRFSHLYLVHVAGLRNGKMERQKRRERNHSLSVCSAVIVKSLVRLYYKLKMVVNNR